jgi:hypothetical protein
MTEQEIRELFKSKNVPLDAKDVWKVQSALVIKHAALERLAASLGIRFASPEIIRSEADECVMLVFGTLGEVQEWSIGEAKIGLNYQVSGKQAGYPYAMSEKRAKDRVILKLARLHGAYSEDEADDFRQQPASESAKFVTNTPRVGEPDDPRRNLTPSQETVAKALVMSLASARNRDDLSKWIADNKKAIDDLPDALRDDVRQAYAGKMHTLTRNAA